MPSVIDLGYFQFDRSTIACFDSGSVRKMPHRYGSGLLGPTAWYLGEVQQTVVDRGLML